MLVGRELEAVRHFEKWLRGNLTGCLFATQFVKQGRMSVQALRGISDLNLLDGLIRASAEADDVPVVVLPFVRSEDVLIEVLNSLITTSTRWSAHHRLNVIPPAGGVALGIDMRTDAGQISEVMGFAPLPTMPVTRRAPYFAFTFWPGTQKNPMRELSPRKRISFVDAAHSLDAASYDSMYGDTERSISSLLAETSDRADHYRKVAFVINATSAAKLAFT